MSCTRRSARPGSAALLQQRLLRTHVERRDLRDRVDQHLIVEATDGVPVDRKSHRIAQPACLPLDLGTLAERKRRWLFVIEGFDIDVGAAVKRRRPRLPGRRESGSNQEERC